ncbi:MAG: DUF262 domain-containing HNH endonuclease family protein [Planctomycetota bacterium]|nr:DUF262 domain-containing HNH endonuclease family protein [Planctomycetota bacterium]
MKIQKCSLRKIVSFINNPDEDGGFWLPNIQRHFVWKEEQICRFFDSIMRKYPIGMLLIWKTKSQIRHRKFIENYKSDIRWSDFYVPENNKKKCIVLDGQQRLQSLFIGLHGSYEGLELYFNILSGMDSSKRSAQDIKYEFKFRDSEEFPYVKFKNLVCSQTTNPILAASNLIKEIESKGRTLTQEEKEKIAENIGTIIETFCSDDGISYQELDSIDMPDLYKEDDIVEVFIRANSGGTLLSKSDLLFSLLASKWDDINQEMEELLDELNKHGFEFKQDFVLKTCLVLLDKGARYEVSKFRSINKEDIKEKWGKIADALKDILDFIRGKTFIQCDKALPSYLALIPMIYARYHFPKSWKNVNKADTYLLLTLLTGTFSGNPDSLIDDCVQKIKETKTFNTDEIFNVIRSHGRTLQLTEDRFWQIGYDSNTIYLLFNLWYKEFNFIPAYDNNVPQIDHIFPQSALKKIKTLDSETGRLVTKYKKQEINQLANCMLLTKEENGAGGKSDTLPEQWFEGKSEKYLDMHLIPKDKSLWKLNRFEEFIKKRKSLIKRKFSYLIV